MEGKNNNLNRFAPNAIFEVKGMTKSKRMLGAKHSQEELEEVYFLYKHFKIKPEPQSSALRKLHHATFLLVTEQQKQSEFSTTQHPELELLEGWECASRVLIYPYNKFSKKKEPMIACLNPIMNPTMREILTNKIPIQICKKCHDEGGSTKSLALPEPKKSQKPQPTSKPQTVQKQREKKKCLTAGCENEIWDGTHCRPCFDKLRSTLSNKQYPNGLPGSPMSIRKKEAESIKRANARMNGNLPIGTLDELTKSELQQEVETDVRTHWSEWYKERGIDIDSVLPNKSKEE